jgi:hypothetical protein
MGQPFGRRWAFWGDWIVGFQDDGKVVLKHVGVQTGNRLGTPTMGQYRTPVIAEFKGNWPVRLPRAVRRCGVCGDDPFPNERGHWYYKEWYCSKKHWDVARKRRERELKKFSQQHKA